MITADSKSVRISYIWYKQNPNNWKKRSKKIVTFRKRSVLFGLADDIHGLHLKPSKPNQTLEDMNTQKEKKNTHRSEERDWPSYNWVGGKGRRGGKRYGGGASQPIEDPSCKKIRRWRRWRGMMMVDYIDLSEDR